MGLTWPRQCHGRSHHRYITAQRDGRLCGSRISRSRQAETENNVTRGLSAWPDECIDMLSWGMSWGMSSSHLTPNHPDCAQQHLATETSLSKMRTWRVDARSLVAACLPFGSWGNLHSVLPDMHPEPAQLALCPAGTGPAVLDSRRRDSSNKGSKPHNGLDPTLWADPRRRSLGPGPPTPQLAPGAAAAPAPPSGPGAEESVQTLSGPQQSPRPAPPPPDDEMPQALAAADEAAGGAGGSANGTCEPIHAQPQALASPQMAPGSAGAAQQLSALSPLLDLAGLAATPPRPLKGAPFEGDTQVPPAAGAAWGAALPGGDPGVERQRSAGAQVGTPLQPLQASARMGEAAGAAAGGDGGLTPGSAMWASSVLASGGAGSWLGPLVMQSQRRAVPSDGKMRP